MLDGLAAPADGRQSPMALTIARGVGRYFNALGLVAAPEVSLRSGRRADLVVLGRHGEIAIVEIKSSIADFRADHKWPEYRAYCDRLFFATHGEMPADLFPLDAGLIIADAFGAAMLRDAPRHPLAAATRKEMTIRLARVAASRLQRLVDPGLQEFDT
jgi:hypothetical protein